MTDVNPAQPAVTQNQMYVAQMTADKVTKTAQDYVKEMRRIADARLLDNFNHPGENGRQKSIEVMHDGVHLGTFTVVETASKAILSDKQALIDWLEVHNPSALEVTVEIRPNVLSKMLEVEGLVLADEDGGPVYQKKNGEILPGVTTKLAGEAVSTRATPFTGKGAAAKKAARDEVLDRLAAHFDVDALAAQHAAVKALEAQQTVAGEVVDQGEESAA
jgi:hypothetical protein